MKKLTIALAFLTALSLPVSAQDFNKGLAAHNDGNYAAAIEEWKPLAEAGDVKSQYKLGIMYENGQGVIQENSEAIKWYRAAADQGDVEAQYKLGFMYRSGNSVNRDNKIAHMWYNIASANGSEKSIKSRDGTAVLMTAAAIEKAQAMARECMNRGYEKCGY